MTPLTYTGDLVAGQRIELIAMPENPCPIPSGERGTVLGVQTVGWANPEQRSGPHPTRCYQVQVRWDCGRTLDLASPPDNFRVLTPRYPEQPWRHFNMDPARSMYIGVEPLSWITVHSRGNETAIAVALGTPDPTLAAEANAYRVACPWNWGAFQERDGLVAYRPLPGPRQRGQDMEFIRRIAPFCAAPFTLTVYDYERPPMWRAEWDGQALTLLVGDVVWRHVASSTST